MALTRQREKATLEFNRIVVREIHGRLVYLMLGFVEGNLEQVIGMRVANVPKKLRHLKRIKFGHLSQALKESGLPGADELKEAMNPDTAPISTLFYFKDLQLPLETVP